MSYAGDRICWDADSHLMPLPDFLSKHDNVVHAVYFGKMDAGAVYADAIRATFGEDQAKQAEMVILARTGRIPNEPIVVHSATPKGMKRRILDAFLSLEFGPDDHKVFGGVERFLPYIDDEAAVADILPGPDVGEPLATAHGP